MCIECRRFPCHPRCPNATHKVRNVCDQCGEELYEDEYYYTDNNGYVYCSEECAIRANGICEKTWEDDF